MNSTKTIDLLRKRNAQMQEELDKLRDLNNKSENDTEEKKVTDLITELEKIKTDWFEALDKLNAQRKEYDTLIEEVKQIRETFASV